MLQEWAQGRGLPTPTYRESRRAAGPHHSPEFRVAVELPGLAPAEGVGRSKRAAEQAAAAAMLKREGVAADAPQWLKQPPRPTRCGFVALIGAPNVGKSTLVNTLVGSKVTIVSHKVQTTRTLVRGIAIEGGAQLIFVDTPGIFAPQAPARPRHGDDSAWSGAHDADVGGGADRCAQGLDDEAEAILAGSPRCGSRRC